ncbi:MAG: Holliday junction branch migration protein RuvA [Mariprofundales bacterium]
MIGWLSGTVQELQADGMLLLNVAGVGYELMISAQTLCSLQTGKAASLHVHTQMRDDQITLFGFSNNRERTLFRQLVTVSGVGARTAMNMLSAMPINELLLAIDSSDAVALARAPGIGKKTAQRLILELRGKLTEDEINNDTGQVSNTNTGIRSNVRSALINLGYKAINVDKAMKTLLKTAEDSSFEDLFKQVLKLL